MKVIILIGISLLTLITTQRTTYNPPCSIANCPIARGQCINNHCYCFEGYVTMQTDYSRPFLYCDYSKMSRWIPFCINFFFPTMGHFVVGNVERGYFMLSLLGLCIIVFFLGGCINSCCAKGEGEGVVKGTTIIIVIILLVFCFLHLKDLIYYGFAWYTDGYGVPLA